jgi:hypothetical protein
MTERLTIRRPWWHFAIVVAPIAIVAWVWGPGRPNYMGWVTDPPSSTMFGLVGLALVGLGLVVANHRPGQAWLAGGALLGLAGAVITFLGPAVELIVRNMGA